MTNEEYYKWYIGLLEMEIEALRSVISEIGVDHPYIQWQKAQTINEFKHSLVKP